MKSDSVMGATSARAVALYCENTILAEKETETIPTLSMLLTSIDGFLSNSNFFKPFKSASFRLQSILNVLGYIKHIFLS